MSNSWVNRNWMKFHKDFKPIILWHFELQRTASMNHPLHPANQPQQRIVKLGFWSLEISTTWVHIGVKSFLREYLLLFFLVWNLGEIFTIQRLYLIFCHMINEMEGILFTFLGWWCHLCPVMIGSHLLQLKPNLSKYCKVGCINAFY